MSLSWEGERKMFRYTKPCKICTGVMQRIHTIDRISFWGCNECSYGENRTGGIKSGD